MKWIKYIISINLLLHGFLYNCFADKDNELIDPMIPITPSSQSKNELEAHKGQGDVESVDEQNKEELTLSAIAMSPSGEFYCIINDLILIENDEIKNFRIDKITNDKVIISDKHNNIKELTIY